jgi:hypothetical protein
MLEFFIQKNTVNGLLAFFTTGIAMWARVEVVLPIFVITAALYMIYIVKNRRNASQTSFLVQLLAPLATIVGAIPYLLNNLYVMGNPFKPTVFAFSRVDVTPASPFNPASPIVDNASATLPVESLNPASVIGQFGTFIASIVHFYLSVDWARLPIDALQVLVLPASGNMGLLPVIPIFVFGVLLIIFLRMKTTSLNAYVVLFLAGISIAVIFSYMYALGIMNNDDGIVPDMRYLSPMYLPLDILGLLMIWKTFEKEDWGIIARNVLGLFLIVAPVVTFSFYLLHPFGDDHNGFVTFFNVLIYGLLAASIPACYLVAKDRADKKVLVTLMILLISLTFTWQMMELFIYAMAKFNGYNFWIPIIGQIYQSVFTVSGI